MEVIEISFMCLCAYVCVSVCVCVLPCNLGECFVSLLAKPITGKNMSPSNKKFCQFLENLLVAETLQCKVLSIGHHP